MAKKRRNNGHRNRNRGHVNRSCCNSCGGLVPKDKGIIKYINKPIVNSSIILDIKKASVYENYTIPKQYYKLIYCISCAVHRKLV